MPSLPTGQWATDGAPAFYFFPTVTAFKRRAGHYHHIGWHTSWWRRHIPTTGTKAQEAWQEAIQASLSDFILEQAPSSWPWGCDCRRSRCGPAWRRGWGKHRLRLAYTSVRKAGSTGLVEGGHSSDLTYLVNPSMPRAHVSDPVFMESCTSRYSSQDLYSPALLPVRSLLIAYAPERTLSDVSWLGRWDPFLSV